MNGSGIRDTTRVLKVRPTTVIEAFKKHRHLESVNRTVLDQTPTPPTTAVNVRVNEAEMDKMGRGALGNPSSRNDGSGM